MTVQFVYVTAKDVEQAKAIGRALVKERLVACANIIPTMSTIYWWEGELTSDDEAVLILKTVASNFHAVKERVKELHTYKIPCVIALDIKDGLSEYLAWVRGETLESHENA